jgi:hypothetical protein
MCLREIKSTRESTTTKKRKYDDVVKVLEGLRTDQNKRYEEKKQIQSTMALVMEAVEKDFPDLDKQQKFILKHHFLNKAEEREFYLQLDKEERTMFAERIVQENIGRSLFGTSS